MLAILYEENRSNLDRLLRKICQGLPFAGINFSSSVTLIAAADKFSKFQTLRRDQLLFIVFDGNWFKRGHREFQTLRRDQLLFISGMFSMRRAPRSSFKPFAGINFSSSRINEPANGHK